MCRVFVYFDAEYYFVLCFYSVYLFFFFKQKTAYEMRISDWSSDVCSSDLGCRWQRADRGMDTAARAPGGRRYRRRAAAGHVAARRAAGEGRDAPADRCRRPAAAGALATDRRGLAPGCATPAHRRRRRRPVARRARSEEQPSELQSPMRLFYAF